MDSTQPNPQGPKVPRTGRRGLTRALSERSRVARASLTDRHMVILRAGVATMFIVGVGAIALLVTSRGDSASAQVAPEIAPVSSTIPVIVTPDTVEVTTTLPETTVAETAPPTTEETKDVKPAPTEKSNDNAKKSNGNSNSNPSDDVGCGADAPGDADGDGIGNAWDWEPCVPNEVSSDYPCDSFEGYPSAEPNGDWDFDGVANHSDPEPCGPNGAERLSDGDDDPIMIDDGGIAPDDNGGDMIDDGGIAPDDPDLNDTSCGATGPGDADGDGVANQWDWHPCVPDHVSAAAPCGSYNGVPSEDPSGDWDSDGVINSTDPDPCDTMVS